MLNTVPIPGDTETGDIVRGPGGEVAMDNPGGLPINDFDLLCDMEDVMTEGYVT